MAKWLRPSSHPWHCICDETRQALSQALASFNSCSPLWDRNADSCYCCCLSLSLIGLSETKVKGSTAHLVVVPVQEPSQQSVVNRCAGESWAADVRKMVAVHDTDGELGTIYLDLLPRSLSCSA